MRSAAARERDHLELNYPRPGRVDRARRVFGLHPGTTRARLMAGMPMLVAEIGSTAPNAYTHCFADDSRLIVLNSGLLDFIEAVVTTLFGATTMHAGVAPAVAAALQPEQAADRLARLYGAWGSGALWREEPLQAMPLDLPGQTRHFVDLLSAAAALFVLSHEIGHAALHADRLRGLPGQGGIGPADELDADTFGLRLVMFGWAGQPPSNWRAAAAGAMIALRILSALGRLGHAFPGDHPPPDTRIAGLRQTLRDICGPEAAYFRIMPLALSYEEQMESAERILLGQDRITVATPERIVSGLLAIAEEVEQGRLGLDRARLNAIARTSPAAPAALYEAGAACARLLGPCSSRHPGSASREAMAGALDALLPDLPAAFQDGFAGGRAEPLHPPKDTADVLVP